jgi:hypothetical protein
MASFLWEVYSNTPAFHDVGANTIVFSGSATDLAAAITVAAWQDGTHLGNGDPGTDQCGGANHARNVKYISGTQYDSGGGTETLNDTNLVATECSMRVKFTDAASVATSSGRFYSYDGATVTTEAVGIDAYAFERGVGATAWTQINDDSGNIGGDNTSERLALSDQVAGTEHYFYLAVSASPESVGGKTQFDFGIALTYS